MSYFDTLPQKIQSGDLDALNAFGRHIHWGCWARPQLADGTLEDFAIASENLSQEMIKVAEIQDGQHILDAGCGFGGTIALINENYKNMNLFGVNIDGEQVARAQEIVIPKSSNSITFLNENACQIPLEASDFDKILAVECIFSFPSRLAFFREAYRLLKPNGTLTICDFLPVEPLAPFWTASERIINKLVGQSYGTVKTDTPITTFIPLSRYKKLAYEVGFELTDTQDITVNTLPTYPILHKIMNPNKSFTIWAGIEGLYFLSRTQLIRYMILQFTK